MKRSRRNKPLYRFISTLRAEGNRRVGDPLHFFELVTAIETTIGIGRHSALIREKLTHFIGNFLSRHPRPFGQAWDFYTRTLSRGEGLYAA